jgi:hypothetical protein
LQQIHVNSLRRREGFVLFSLSLGNHFFTIFFFCFYYLFSASCFLLLIRRTVRGTTVNAMKGDGAVFFLLSWSLNFFFSKEKENGKLMNSCGVVCIRSGLSWPNYGLHRGVEVAGYGLFKRT